MVAINTTRERDRADDLEQALHSNREIGMAMGILMARGKCTSEQAFDLLRNASQNLNLRLRDVAARIVDTGELPDRG